MSVCNRHLNTKHDDFVLSVFCYKHQFENKQNSENHLFRNFIYIFNFENISVYIINIDLILSEFNFCNNRNKINSWAN